MLFVRRFNVIFVFFIVLGGVMGVVNSIILDDPDSFINSNVTNNSANETKSYIDKLNSSSKDVESTINDNPSFTAAIVEALGLADFTLFRVGVSLLSGFLLPGLIIRDALLPLSVFAPGGASTIAYSAISAICIIIQAGCTFIQIRYAIYLIRKI